MLPNQQLHPCDGTQRIMDMMLMKCVIHPIPWRGSTLTLHILRLQLKYVTLDWGFVQMVLHLMERLEARIRLGLLL